MFVRVHSINTYLDLSAGKTITCGDGNPRFTAIDHPYYRIVLTAKSHDYDFSKKQMERCAKVELCEADIDSASFFL